MSISRFVLGCFHVHRHRIRDLAVAGLIFRLMPGALHAINGLEGTFEFACDAPWRIEPRRLSDGKVEYGAIPIHVAIHDGVNAGLDDLEYLKTSGGLRLPVTARLPKNLVSLGRFQAITVRQVQSGAVNGGLFDGLYPIERLHEIEQTLGSWLPDEGAPAPVHQLCRRWAGDDPEAFKDLTRTSEWHASLWYEPKVATPGSTLTLEIEVILERDAWPNVSADLPGPGPGRIEVDLQKLSRYIRLRNYVRVHLAKDPLPRFSSQWLYGDFHYHAQGTDNEGESAYSYRAVNRAMGAMGMDFAFATEHASASEQLIDVDLSIDLLEEGLGALGGFLGLPGGDSGDPLEEDDAKTVGGVLRDMNHGRFAFCHRLLHGPRGANWEPPVRANAGRMPQNYLSYGVVPQIFLGGEVDVIPEVRRSVAGELPSPPPANASPFEFLAYYNRLEAWRPNPLPYGNRLVQDLNTLRKPGVRAIHNLFEPSGDVYLLHDFQGLDTYSLYGRQHLVYYPGSSNLLAGAESAFVPSYTSRYGGATRRLTEPHQGREALLREIERKGVAFVAHHLNRCDTCSNGPEGVPWTADHMLAEAFRSPAVLGLQFWNEDPRHQTKICSHGFCRNQTAVYAGEEIGYERDESFSIMGYTPSDLKDVALPLAERRGGFLAHQNTAGSEFILRAFELSRGLWQERTSTVEHQLHHGAHDWDQLNLRGLDFEANRTLLPWLTPGQPRRVFMGGGSDAHGDLSFRRAGYFLGATEATDTAIGKPRNLVFVGAPDGNVVADLTPVIDPDPLLADAGASRVRPPFPEFLVRAHSHQQVVGALRRGRFAVTDGPIIRIAIDMNGNGAIDEADVPMGSLGEFRTLLEPIPGRQRGTQYVTILTEVRSTEEFGPISKVDLYVGVHPAGRPGGSPRVYAAADHGVRDPARAPGSQVVENYFSFGRLYQRMADGYWLDPRLTITAPRGSAFGFVARTVIDLNEFEGGKGIPCDRFFVRAFVATAGADAEQRPARYGFANPLWILRSALLLTEFPPVFDRPPVLPPAALISQKAPGVALIEYSGRLQGTTSLEEPFVDVEGAGSPWTVPAEGPYRFFRVR